MDNTFQQELTDIAANVFKDKRAQIQARTDAVAELQSTIDAAAKGVGKDGKIAYNVYNNAEFTQLIPEKGSVGPTIQAYDGGLVQIFYRQNQGDETTKPENGGQTFETNKLENKDLKKLATVLATEAKDQWVAKQTAANRPPAGPVMRSL